MGSYSFTLDSTDWKKIGTGFLVAIAGAVIVFLGQLTEMVDFGPYAVIVGAVCSTIINAIRKWQKNNTIPPVMIAFLCAGLMATNAFAIGYDMIGQGSCECGNQCRCQDTGEQCNCDSVASAHFSVTDTVSEATHRNRQVLFFTASWCGPCQQWKQTQAKRLKEAGWSFGSDTDRSCIIREIDADARPDLVDNYRITSFPTFLCLEDNLIVSRFERGVTGSELNSAWETQGNDESSRSVSDEAVEQVEGRAAGGYRLVDSRAAAGADPGGHARQLRVETTGNRDRKEPEVVSCTVCGSQSCSRVSQGVRVQRYRTGAVRGTTRTVGYVLRTFGCRTGRCP